MVHEGVFISGFVTLFLIAGFFILKPMTKIARIVLFPLFPVLVFLLYGQWGSWSKWQVHEKKLQHLALVKKELTRYKSPADLIEAFKARLKMQPKSAKGWYLLGKLYSSQGKWQEASNAFAEAVELDAQNKQIQINYLLSLWELNQRQFNVQSRILMHTLLKNYPDEPNVLMLAARAAFEEHDSQKAIHYWQKVLALVPPNSKEATFLRKAMREAEKLKKPG